MPTRSPDRPWWRAGLLLFAVGWGANHFVPLLFVYRRDLGLDASAVAILLGTYALGLVPGLLLAGPLSDRVGRRAIALPAATGAFLASAVLGASGGSFVGLALGRFLYGLAAGAVMSPVSAWVLELSAPGAGPRRATIAMSAGFGTGPLVSGLCAELAPAPTVTPYAVHLVVLATAIALVWPTPNVSARSTRPLLRLDLGTGGWRRFAREAAPMAPFVFAFPTIAFAALPSMLAGAFAHAPIAFAGIVAACVLASGVLIQPYTRRGSPVATARIGLAIGALGIGIGALAVIAQQPALVLACAPVLGIAYGTCMTSGLRTVEAIAPAHARGGLAGVYLVLTYVGFATPLALAQLARAIGAVASLGLVAGLALVVAVALRAPGAAR
ncbi:MAG: MFS transporter [Deltaproteobacteria bacterium]|nr:MFS transporter [Deltaproteobacteria bacterium]